MKRATHCLILLVITCSLFVLYPRHGSVVMAAPGIVARQVVATPRPPVVTSAPPAPPVSSAPPPVVTPPPSAPPVSAPPTTPTPSITPDQPTVAPPTQAPTQTQAAPTTPVVTQGPTRTAAAAPGTTLVSSISTDAAGQAVTVVVTQTNSDASSSSATPSATAAPSTSSGLGTGSIIGLSVAGGIAVIGVLGFFVWKFTRKRFSDFDDNEAIKWPELNAAHGATDSSHPLPLNNTGRAGFETGSEASLSRAPSGGAGYANSVATSSVPDYNSGDPYAVPPLPHLNPGQPYRDDPTANAYYDPYRGPVPNTFNETDQGWAPDAIPMTQLAGRRSPGPQMAYDAGRGSPAPGGPQAALGYGQASAYGGGGGAVLADRPGFISPERRQSPGPAQAYVGRQSPGPGSLYGRQSPGPQAAYR